MNQEPDCVTPQTSYQVQASEQQISTEQQWFSFKASNENAQNCAQWKSHVPHLQGSVPCYGMRNAKPDS